MSYPPDAIPQGTRLLGFEIVDCLDQGGFGIVYKAIAPNGRPVALKEFFPAGDMRRAGIGVVPTSDTRDVLRLLLRKFDDTVAVHRRLRHPNIVKIHGYFDSALAVDEGEPTGYAVMEYIEGGSLTDRFPEPAAIDEAEFRAVFMQIMDALALVHAQDLVHRDIKPSNVIVRPDGTPVLIDFGNLAIGVDRRAGKVTTIPVVSHGYSPPEQHQSALAHGPFTDVYALAATIYRLLAGRPPASAADRSIGLASGAPDTLVPFSNTRVPPWALSLWPAVERAMEIDVSARTATIAALANDLGWQAEKIDASTVAVEINDQKAPLDAASTVQIVTDDKSTVRAPMWSASSNDVAIAAATRTPPTRELPTTRPPTPVPASPVPASGTLEVSALVARHAPTVPPRDAAHTNIPLGKAAQRRLAAGAALQAASNDPDFRLAQRSENGEAAAMTELARRLLHSAVMTPEMIRRADTLLRTAAKSGFGPAMSILGRWLIERTTPPPARDDGVYWLGRASEMGEPEAQTFLGRDILARSRSPGERRRGFLLIEKAAQSGFAAGMTEFGKLHESGIETAPNPRLAVFWFREAATAGDLDGMTHLARLLSAGVGVHEGRQEAFDWLARAAAANHPLAMCRLGLAFENGLGTEVDLVEANKWLRRAALTDDADGVRAYARFIVQHANLALVPEAVEFWQARARKIERG